MRTVLSLLPWGILVSCVLVETSSAPHHVLGHLICGQIGLLAASGITEVRTTPPPLPSAHSTIGHIESILVTFPNCLCLASEVQTRLFYTGHVGILTHLAGRCVSAAASGGDVHRRRIAECGHCQSAVRHCEGQASISTNIKMYIFFTGYISLEKMNVNIPNWQQPSNAACCAERAGL